MRIELDGDWAELRPAKKIPHGKTMEYRQVFYKVAALGAGADPEDEGAAGRAILENGGLQVMDELANALVLAVVKEWSYGEVTLETLLDVPTADLHEIQKACATDEYTSVLQPSLDEYDRDPDSPTKPSGD